MYLQFGLRHLYRRRQ